MSDDTTEPDTTEPTEAAEPTTPAESADEVESTTTGAPAAAPAAERRGVFVPRWLAILIGLVLAVGLVGGAGFWLGRETADGDGRREASERTFEPGDAPTAPSAPRIPDLPDNPGAPQPQGRQLLGVAIEAADGGGVTVVRVASGSPADDAGLEVGDVITEVDGESVDGPADFVLAIRSNDPGDEITITYERDGATTTETVRLEDLSSDPGSAS